MGTHKLDGGHILLPPEVFLETRPCSRESIVEIHDDMHHRINHGVEAAHSTSWKKRKKHCFGKTMSFLISHGQWSKIFYLISASKPS